MRSKRWATRPASTGMAGADETKETTMNRIDNIDIALTRWDCGAVKSITATCGEPDACGHRFVVDAHQNSWGGHYCIQTNFSEFYEARGTISEAYSVVMGLICNIDANGDQPLDYLVAGGPFPIAE